MRLPFLRYGYLIFALDKVTHVRFTPSVVLGGETVSAQIEISLLGGDHAQILASGPTATNLWAVFNSQALDLRQLADTPEEPKCKD